MLLKFIYVGNLNEILSHPWRSDWFMNTIISWFGKRSYTSFCEITFSLFMSNICFSRKIFKLSFFCWTFWTQVVAGTVLSKRACSYFNPSFHLSIRLSRWFLESGSLRISKFWHGVNKHLWSCVTEPDFFGNKNYPTNWKKWTKNRVFWIYWKHFGHQFFLNLVYNASLYYLLYFLLFSRE